MLKRNLENLSKDASGATAIEYALIAALISVSAVSAMNSMGTALNGLFDLVSLRIAAAEAAVPDPVPQCVEVNSSCNQ